MAQLGWLRVHAMWPNVGASENLLPRSDDHDSLFIDRSWIMTDRLIGLIDSVCKLKLKLSVLTLSQRLVTPRTPRISGAT
eukprot:COSAG06_NODE_7621_length_2437_cov_1.724979_1_plen_79_part_10